MLKNILLLATISALTECYKPTPIEITSKEYKTYSVTKIYRPKHFYVDLKDIKSGKVHKKVYISKHCNEWRKLKLVVNGVLLILTINVATFMVQKSKVRLLFAKT